MLITVCREKLADMDARRMATYFRTVYTAEELDMVIKSGEVRPTCYLDYLIV